MISKELLSTVNEVDVYDIISTSYNEIKYSGAVRPGTTSVYTINTYELAHLCKEWARLFNSDKVGPVGGYPLFSRSGDNWSKAACFCDKIDLRVPTQYANYEPEAIFKACQWILDNNTNKGLI